MMERICSQSDLTEGEVLRVPLPGYAPLAVTMVDDSVFVFPDTCPHAEASLSEGWVEEGRVVCGVHFAEFGLADDSVLNRPAGCGHLVKFAAEVRDGDVFADLKDAERA